MELHNTVIDIKNAKFWDELTKDGLIAPSELWEVVKENGKVLINCKQHSFSFDLNDKLKCKNCGGFMRIDLIFAYQNGFKAAGGNPKDILNHSLEETK